MCRLTITANSPSYTMCSGSSRRLLQKTARYASVPSSGCIPSSRATSWTKRKFEKISPAAALSSITPGNPGLSQRPSPNLGGRKVVLESNENMAGENADGNWEIFLYDTRKLKWTQLTHTVAPVENRRPERQTIPRDGECGVLCRKVGRINAHD